MLTQIWVRTPLEFQVWGYAVLIKFKPSKEPAGKEGAKLEAAYGAWEDRPLSDDEPRFIHLREEFPPSIGDLPSKLDGYVLRSACMAMLEAMTVRAALLTDGAIIGFWVERVTIPPPPVGVFTGPEEDGPRKGVLECRGGYNTSVLGTGSGHLPPSTAPRPFVIRPVHKQ